MTFNFDLFQQYILNHYGIQITEQKANMLQNKIVRVLRRYHIKDFDELWDRLNMPGNGEIINSFQDEITVHKTEFFREQAHFDFISCNQAMILEKNPRIQMNRKIKAWSAACSSGEEPYSIAMVLKDCLPQEIKIKVLGTDISRKVLQTASQGIYQLKPEHVIDPLTLERYFNKQGSFWAVKKDIKEMVTFRQFNLMREFPFTTALDIIFCRNVMIYFPQSIQMVLLAKIEQVLVPGGLLFLGHSETMINKKLRLKYLGPSTYMKI